MKSNQKNFIKRLQAQKEDALEFIVDEYLPLIKGITYKVLGPNANEGAIEECINDIFLAIWNHSKKFYGEPDDFKKWIGAVAKFKAIDYYRQALKTKESTNDYLELPSKYSVEDEIIRIENRTELLNLINRLELLDQKIFVMKFFLGYSSEEIASKLGQTRTSIDNRIYRGKKKLIKKATNFQLGGSFI